MKKILLILLCFSFAFANISDFMPKLTQRVMDSANILTKEQKTNLIHKFEKLDTNTTREVVVATTTSLHGYSIEEFATGLFRAWGIGKKDKNNGVLLLVAPNERRVRIEVGYGLEGVLTDYLASKIIQESIIPEFKKNAYQRGILKGANEIVKVLSGESIKESEFEFDNLSNFSLILYVVFYLLPMIVSPFFFWSSDSKLRQEVRHERYEHLRKVYKNSRMMAKSAFFHLIIFLIIFYSILMPFGLETNGDIFVASGIASLWGLFLFFSTKCSELFEHDGLIYGTEEYEAAHGSSGGYSGGGGSSGGGGASGSW